MTAPGCQSLPFFIDLPSADSIKLARFYGRSLCHCSLSSHVCNVSNETEEETDVMRKLSIVVTALCVCTAFAVVASAQEKTLCERLGGTPAISAVVDSFAGKVLKDDRINKKFAKSDANRLVTNLKGQIGAAAKCPGVKYKGKSMKNITQEHGRDRG